jgi:eukaryotic-like serine/threonine-protein kinase
VPSIISLPLPPGSSPLRTRDGYNLGTLCIIDHQPRTMSHQDLRTLEDLAALVMNGLEERLQSRCSA